jgi:uncharacterized membrane protein
MEMPPVETYLVKSILVTILCFMPFGVVALVHSAMAEAKRSSGDWRGAREASRTANKWANLAIIIGIALLVVFLIIGVIITLTIGETVANQGQILGR